MKYFINSNELKKATEKLYLLIDTKNPVGATDKFYLSFDKDILTIQACDIRNGMLATAQVKTKANAIDYPVKTILITALDLYNLAKSFSNKELQFTILDDEIKIETETGRYRFNTYPADNWNIIDLPLEEDITLRQSISTDRIKRVLNKIIYIAGNGELSSKVAGVLFDFDYSQLRIVATDGYRIIKYTLDGISTAEPQKIRLNTVSTKILARIISEGTQATLKYSSSGIIVETGSFVYFSKIIQEKYVNYESILEKELQQEKQGVFIDKLSLYESVLRLYGTLQIDKIEDKEKKAFIEIYENKVKLTIDSVNNNYSLTDYIDCLYTGPRLSFAINLSQLKEILANIEVEGQIKFLIGETNKPILITVPQAPEDLLVLFMPYRETRKKQEEETTQTNDNNNTEGEL